MKPVHVSSDNSWKQVIKIIKIKIKFLAINMSYCILYYEARQAIPESKQVIRLDPVTGATHQSAACLHPSHSQLFFFIISKFLVFTYPPPTPNTILTPKTSLAPLSRTTDLVKCGGISVSTGSTLKFLKCSLNVNFCIKLCIFYTLWKGILRVFPKCPQLNMSSPANISFITPIDLPKPTVLSRIYGWISETRQQSFPSIQNFKKWIFFSKPLLI